MLEDQEGPPTSVPETSKARRAVLRIALALAGLAVIAAVFWRIGWPGIRANLLAIGPWFLGLVALNLVVQGAFVAGLRSVLEPSPPWRRFPRLFAIYVMGDAANYLAPAGGDALKAHLLREFGGGEAAMSAVTLHKHADLIAQCLMAVLGVSFALARFDLPRAVEGAAIAGTLALLALLVLMTWALGRGAFSPILRRLAGWKLLAARLQRFQSGAEAVDARIRRFHASRGRRFFGVVALAFLGWCGGTLETWIVLKLIAPSAGWSEAIAIETLAMVLNNVLVFIPGKLGGAEGIRTWVFLLVGLSASQGAAYSLVRRSRELLWVLPGWLLLLQAHPHPSSGGWRNERDRRIP